MMNILLVVCKFDDIATGACKFCTGLYILLLARIPDASSVSGVSEAPASFVADPSRTVWHGIHHDHSPRSLAANQNATNIITPTLQSVDSS